MPDIDELLPQEPSKGPPLPKGWRVEWPSLIKKRLRAVPSTIFFRTKFTEGQIIVIKSKAIYGWRTWVTVKRDDPEHNQVWVKEITPAVKYEDIEEED